MTLQQRADIGLATALRISVSRLARRLRVERLVPELAEPALSDTKLAALATLERHGAMTPGELAEHEKVQPPSMTRVIAALVDWQLVARAPHPTDRRIARDPQLPAVRDRAGRVEYGHLDAACGAGLAGAGADPRQRHGPRHRHRAPVPASAAVQLVGRCDRRPLSQAPHSVRHPGLHGRAGAHPWRAGPDQCGGGLAGLPAGFRAGPGRRRG